MPPVQSADMLCLKCTKDLIIGANQIWSTWAQNSCRLQKLQCLEWLLLLPTSICNLLLFLFSHFTTPNSTSHPNLLLSLFIAINHFSLLAFVCLFPIFVMALRLGYDTYLYFLSVWFTVYLELIINIYNYHDHLEKFDCGVQLGAWKVELWSSGKLFSFYPVCYTIKLPF